MVSAASSFVTIIFRAKRTGKPDAGQTNIYSCTRCISELNQLYIQITIIKHYHCQNGEFYYDLS